MHYIEFLAGVHRRLEPTTYLEIGVKAGRSLTLSQCRAVAIDPAFRLEHELHGEVTLERTTSEEYFARADALAPFEGEPADLAFIDGMHLAEFALRDFIDVERHTRWSSVVVFDDVFPRWPEEAARDRHTTNWTGDVYKVLAVLRRFRPDLVLLPVHTEPTGLLLVLGCDPSDEVLPARLAELSSAMVVPDPQSVPADVVDRTGALDPQQVLDAPLWAMLRTARRDQVSAADGMPAIREAAAALDRDARVDFAVTPIERPPVVELPPKPVPAPTRRRLLRRR